MCTRELDGRAVEFGTSGYTMDHVFVLYDRESDSVWYPLGEGTFDAVAGERRGDSIPFLDEPAPMPLGEWLDVHPDSQILLPTPDDIERRREMASRPYMGVRLGERDGALFIDDVVPDGPAAGAGLQAGDALRRFAGADLRSRADLRDAMGDYAPGDTVTIVVERDGEDVTIEFTLGSRG